MPALLDVAGRTAEATNEKIAEARLRANQVVLGIHRAEDIVRRYLRVERPNEARETVFTNTRVEVVFCHNSLCRRLEGQHDAD